MVQSKSIYLFAHNMSEVLNKKKGVTLPTIAYYYKEEIEQALEGAGLDPEHNFHAVSDKLTALFDTLNYKVDPYTGLEDRVNEKGEYTYPVTTTEYEGKKFALRTVTVNLMKNRGHDLRVRLGYSVDDPLHEGDELKFEKGWVERIQPLYNPHYYEECEVEVLGKEATGEPVFLTKDYTVKKVSEK